MNIIYVAVHMYFVHVCMNMKCVLYISTNICVLICMCEHACICVYVFMYIVHLCLSELEFLYVSVCEYACVFLYVYIVHVCVCVNIHV